MTAIDLISARHGTESRMAENGHVVRNFIGAGMSSRIYSPISGLIAFMALMMPNIKKYLALVINWHNFD